MKSQLIDNVLEWVVPDIAHVRKAPVPVLHGAYATVVTRGAHRRLPILVLDGRPIGDSTAIIEALEAYRPEPPLYPSDPADRTIGDLSDCLEPMLRMLSDADAALLRRIDLHGEAQTDLATSLGVPLSTLKSRVQRARTKLRGAFDDCCSIELARNGAPIGFERGAGCDPGCASDERES